MQGLYDLQGLIVLTKLDLDILDIHDELYYIDIVEEDIPPLWHFSGLLRWTPCNWTPSNWTPTARQRTVSVSVANLGASAVRNPSLSNPLYLTYTVISSQYRLLLEVVVLFERAAFM